MTKRNTPAAFVLIVIGAAVIYALQNMPAQSEQPLESPRVQKDDTPGYCETHPDACGGDSRTTNLDAALAELKQEPKIKDLHVDGFYVYVGVLDDKTDRTGYAMYVCEVMR